jgi:hypothetical protein
MQPTKESLQQLAGPLDEKIRLGGLNAVMANFDAIALLRALVQQHEEAEAKAAVEAQAAAEAAAKAETQG